MNNFSEPFKLDKNNVRYIDGKDVKISPYTFGELKKSYIPKRKFYTIDGVDNYIIKNTTDNPRLFNGTRTKILLKKYMEKQPYFSNIDFPVGYYQEKNKVKGTIIPYYENSISLYWFVVLSRLSKISKYYNHSSDDVDNLVLLYLDILHLLQRLYEEDIAYLDIHAGNFLLSNNEVKLIDFEPGYVYFGKKNTIKYRYIILENYAALIRKTLRRLGYDDILFYSSEYFDETEDRVNYLRKELRR